MEYKPSFVDQLDVDYICHHGIKGMHWGVRRFQNPDGSLTSAGKARQKGSKHNSSAKTSVVNQLTSKWNSLDSDTKKTIIRGAATLAAAGAITAYGRSQGGEGIVDSYVKGVQNISEKNPLAKKIAYRVDRNINKSSDKMINDFFGSNTVYNKKTGEVVDNYDIPDDIHERYREHAMRKEQVATDISRTFYEKTKGLALDDPRRKNLEKIYDDIKKEAYSIIDDEYGIH